MEHIDGRPIRSAMTRACVAVAGGLLLAGCTSNGPARQEARAVATASPDSIPVQVVTSTNFAYTPPNVDPTNPSGGSVLFGTADTTVRKLPLDSTYNIAGTGRFIIRIEIPPTATDTPHVQAHVDVYIDGQLRGSAQGDLSSRMVQYIFLSSGG
jgi:hypothetical protein